MIEPGQAIFWIVVAVAALKNIVQGWQGRGQLDQPGLPPDFQRYVIYGLYLAVWWTAVQQSYATPPAILFAGAAAILAGSGITLSAMWMLGQSYRERIEPGEDAILQTTGIFAWVRHPMRVGLAIELIGAAACSQTWTAVVLTIGVCILLVVRSRQEETLLVARYGDAYARYRATTPAFPLGRPARRTRHG